MRPSSCHPAIQLTVLACLAVGALGCASTPSSSAPGFTDPRPPGALEVRLEFGEHADLDLFVTDPRQEALYFGNNPSLGGGALDVDRRCDAETPRVEIARFATPPPGRYRIGVSYDRSCRFRRKPTPFRVGVRADGLEMEHYGEIAPGDFEHIVLEFDLRRE